MPPGFPQKITTFPSRYSWAVALMLSITIASHFRLAPPMPSIGLFPFDKVAHLCIFGLLSTTLIRASSLNPKQHPYFFVFYPVFTTSLFGLFDEFHQSFNPVRVFSLWDLSADILGASIAALAYTYLPPYRSLLERPLCAKSGLPSGQSTTQMPPC